MSELDNAGLKKIAEGLFRRPDHYLQIMAILDKFRELPIQGFSAEIKYSVKNSDDFTKVKTEIEKTAKSVGAGYREEATQAFGEDVIDVTLRFSGCDPL